VSATLIEEALTANAVSTTDTKVLETETNVQTIAVASIDIEEMPIFKELRVLVIVKMGSWLYQL
jgi:hypothetical protein